MVFRKDIQGWRAITFLMVFVFHLNKSWWSGGFLGVDLFFVISGYLMATIIDGKLQRGDFKYLEFLKKRIFRIVPAYYALLFFVLAVGAWIFLSVDALALSQTLNSATFFISNNYFSSGESYFGAQLNENPLLHTWSLSVEMQFYLLLPLVALLFRKYFRYALLVIGLAITVYYQFFIGDSDGSVYFSMLGRIPEFLAGALFALFLSKGFSLSTGKQNIVATLTLLALGCFSFVVDEHQFQIGVISLLPCLAMGLLLSLNDTWINKVLSLKIFTFIGDFSYSLYLWHWPLIAFIRYRYSTYDLSINQLVFVVVLTFVLGWLSYVVVESKFKLGSRRQFYVLGAVMAFLFLGSWQLPLVMKGKQTDEIYTKPVFGLKSHKFSEVETFGDTHRKDSIFLFGDSNALMLKPFFNAIGKQNHFSFRTLTCDGYLPLSGVKFEEEDKSTYPMYQTALDLMPKVDREIEKARYLFLCTISYESSPSVQQAIKQLISRLKPHQRLILINSFPYVDKDPIRVNNGYVRKSDEVFKVYKRDDNLDFLNSVANGKNVFVYDIGKSDWFKTAPYVNDTVMYYNATHLNTVGSQKLAVALEDDFMTIFNKIKKQSQ